MDPATVGLRAASAAGAAMGRAGERDKALKRAARLLLIDLEAIDDNLSRALAENTKRYLARERLRSPRWSELQAEFAGALAHSENDEWEIINGLFETERFLDSKRVEALGEDAELDTREQGWVWFACATHVPLRRDMHTMASTPWWRRRLSTPMKVVRRHMDVTPPPLPPAVRELVDNPPPGAPQHEWDLASMTQTVQRALALLSTPGPVPEAR
jgi:hypothetical protein